jgi:putative ABC transport system permease protein
MQELFGIPMNSIMVALLALLGVALLFVAYVLVRNRIMFFIGLRNIPRRPAQTVLIIIGLMLSTLIISAAFTTGDTVDRSFTSTSYRLLGHTDEFVLRRGEGDSGPREINSAISADDIAMVRSAIADDPNIDGFLPIMWSEVPVINPTTRQSEPDVNFAGLDAYSLEGFPDVVSVESGEALDVASLGAGELFMNESAADALDADPGDMVEVYVNSQPNEFMVVDIVTDNVLGGVGDFNRLEGMVTRLDTLAGLLGRPEEANFIAVSNAGGVRSGLNLTDEVLASMNDAFIAGEASSAGVEPYDVKRDLVEGAEEAGNFMATFFVIFGLFSIASGMLLIVMIFVMLAAERKSELGMARAVGTRRSHLVQMFLSEGMAYNMVAALVGCGLGVVVAFGIANVLARIFAEFNFDIEPYVTVRSLVISYCLGVVLTFLTVVFSSWRVSNLNIVRAIRDIPEPPARRMGWRWLATGVLSLLCGLLMVYAGLTSDLAFPFALGFTIIAAATAIFLRFLNLPERPVLTSMGLLLLLIWGLVAGERLKFLLGDLEGGPEMFFLSGAAMVAAATFVLVYNADLVLVALTRASGAFGSILPAVRTAVAYPLASKFRTGMTLAMISLVIFALTMMSTMNMNFDRIFLADSARGGWDVIADENLSNPIEDLSSALEAEGSEVQVQFRTEGKINLAGESEVAELGQSSIDYESYPIFGADEGFVDGSDVRLSARARGYDSDAAVWQALKTETDVAVVDRFTVEGGGFNFGDAAFSISGIDTDDDVFDPISLSLRNPVTGTTRSVEVIGVVGLAPSATFFGIFVPDSTFRGVFGEPIFSRHYVGLENPGDAKEVAREIEAALLPTGLQVESLKQQIDDQQALMRNFFLLMQGFVALGLCVGIAAVGVIAFRTVVERRQQIGMLRAIGYKRSMVALSFMLESSFVTLLAIASGVGLAIWLSFFLITSSSFPETDVGYAIPWTRIFIFSGLAFVASLVMTYVPSQQAASIPTAEALRYE